MAYETCKGVENLWSDGNRPGARHYPDYVREVRLHYFKASFHVLPLLWVPKEYWFHDLRTFPWDVVKPLFLEINKLRRLLTIIFARKLIPEAEFSPQDFHSLILDFRKSFYK